ncbi:MAG: CsbD family protein [Rhodobacteraceae bacterium]|nr:CsbD family protein [Paracoccaceae bacterium]
MNKNRVKGTAKQAEGAVKEGLGKLTGDKSLEVEGKVQKVYGQTRDDLRKA